MYNLSDLALLVASIIGIILPRLFYKSKLVVYFGTITLSCMFLTSIIGAWLISLFSGLDTSTLFTRLFIVIGVSNVVYISGQIEMMRRLNITREAFETAIKAEHEKEQLS